MGGGGKVGCDICATHPKNLLKSPSGPIMDGGQLSIIGPLTWTLQWIELSRGTVGFRLETKTSGASSQSRHICVSV